MDDFRLVEKKQVIEQCFDNANVEVVNQTDLNALLTKLRGELNLPKNMSLTYIAQFLCTHSKLKKYTLDFPYRTETRFTWRDQHTLRLLQTVKPGAYFTHHTAMSFHSLAETQPEKIYLNYEQRPHLRESELEQKNIDGAFKRKPRHSNNSTTVDGKMVILINGMNTRLLGVEQIVVNPDEELAFFVSATNLERTLLDIVVRPQYSGGVASVRIAFQRALGRVDIERLFDMLRRLNYAYPYHQAVGYYLEAAGYPSAAAEVFENLPMKHRFYLDYAMKETEFSERWKLYVPKF